MKKKKQSRRESFYHAFCGLGELIREEINFKIELGCAALALSACGLLQVSRTETALVLLCCIAVLALEGVNTAIEHTVDLVTAEYKELARRAKDAAAGAVLIASIGAALIGAVLFVPYLVEWVKGL